MASKYGVFACNPHAENSSTANEARRGCLAGQGRTRNRDPTGGRGCAWFFTRTDVGNVICWTDY